MFDLGFVSFILFLNSVGIIGVMQWSKELVIGIKNKDFDKIWKSVTTFILSIFSGIVAWKTCFGTSSWHVAIPLALGVLSITQLGYECILKNVNTTIALFFNKIIDSIGKENAK